MYNIFSGVFSTFYATKIYKKYKVHGEDDLINLKKKRNTFLLQ